MSDLLSFLGSRNKLRWLTLISNPTNMVITFHKDKLRGACSSDGTQRLGARLVDAGLIDDCQLQAALRVQSSEPDSTVLGLIMIGLGVITKEQLDSATARQFGEMVFRLLIYPAGDFHFDPNIPDLRGETVNISIETEKRFSRRFNGCGQPGLFTSFQLQMKRVANRLWPAPTFGGGRFPLSCLITPRQTCHFRSTVLFLV